MDKPTIEEMVKEAREWLDNSSEEERNTFINTERENLGEYHHSLGMNIRNHFRLWDHEWVPVIKDGCDHAPDHPDTTSFKVIEAVWDSVQPPTKG